MGRRSVELTVGEKEAIIKLIKAGTKQSVVADVLSVSKSTISDVWKRYVTRGTVVNNPRCGRTPFLDEREKRRVILCVRKNRRNSLAEITSKVNNSRTIVNDAPVSSKTIDRFLKSEGYARRITKKTMVVREVNLRKRVSFCYEKRNLTVDNYWKGVIFSDESQIVVGNDNRIFVWRKKDEGYRPDCVCPRSQRKLSVMIWGCITYNGVGTICCVDGIINAVKYIQILEDNLWPVIARHFANDRYVFQQDNAPVHKARVVSEYFENNNISTLEWPPQSPDLNIIENVWLKIKIKLKSMVHNINNKNQLYEAITDVWRSLDTEYIQSLYNTIPDRLKEVRKAKGNITKY